MIPETVVTVYVAALISNSLNLRLDRPVTKEKSESVSAILNGVMVFGISIVTVFLYLFKQVQSEEGFDITLIRNTNWSTVAIIIAIGVVSGIIIYFASKALSKNKIEK